MSKVKISLWAKTSKSGNPYLSGKDKEAGIMYFVFKDKNNPNIRNVLTKPIGDMEAKFTNLVDLELKTKKDSDEVFYAKDDYFLGENNFYYESPEDAAKGGVRYLTRRDGSTVVGRDGEPLEKNSHVLLIG